VVAREVQRLGLDLAHAIGLLGLADRRIAVLEAALADRIDRDVATPSVRDERSAPPVDLKPKPNPKPNPKAKISFVPVMLPDRAVRPPAPAVDKRKRPRKLTAEDIERWSRVKFA
jgi:hypothetical protein